MGYPVAGAPVGDESSGPDFDPLGLLDYLAGLDPAAAARHTAWLAGEFTRIALGRGDAAFGEGDARFADRTWRDNPFYRVLGQSYRAFEEWAGQLAGSVDGPWERQARARYWTSVLTAAAAPTNFLPTNPAAIKRAFETGGLSVLRGSRNMLRDLARGGMPRMVDREPFGIGEKLACTPGVVVYRDEIFELLQYTPTTASVRAVPLLMVPPEINRHYVLDLAPGRSVAEFAVGSGIQTFMIVWRNPQPGLGHGRWGLDDYLTAQARAAEVVKKITRSDTVNWFGLCAGGITAALLLGYQAATGDTSAGSATFVVTMLTNRCPNIVGMFDSPSSRASLRRAAAAGQVFPGSGMRTNFAWLRPNDLVFNYLVSGWLLGEDPPSFDVLAWNDDATGLSARFALECTAALVDASASGQLTVLGTPIELAKIGCDSFHIAGYTDHISPWRACYTSTQVLGGDKELVVVKSGHIQSFVNPVGRSRYDYWTGPPTASDPDQWLATAAVHHGSWWPRWAEWLTARSGPEKAAPRTLGNRSHPPLGAAPGSYVHG